MRQLFRFKWVLAASGVGVLLAQSVALAQITVYPPAPALQPVLASPDIAASLAQQLSVRILTDGNAGSGVIIRRDGQRYLAVTNAHVVENSSENRYEILTSDSKTYEGRWLKEIHVYTQDIALVEFQSQLNYPVAQFRDLRDLQMGEPLYAAGFPNWQPISATNLADTRSLGFRAFQLTVGQVGMVLPQPLTQGYQLGYTNEVDPGMSGGAILDRWGRLVGINGALKYPPQGMMAFRFADGTLPPDALFEAMNSLNWAIPIFTIQAFLATHPVSVLQ